jgi:hypothetical protein
MSVDFVAVRSSFESVGMFLTNDLFEVLVPLLIDRLTCISTF